MITIITSAFYGALIGFICCLGIYLLSIVGEILHGAWQIISCQCNFHSVIPVWSKSTFWHIAIFCIVGGFIIGIIYGIVSEIQAKKLLDADARAKRAQQDAEQRKDNARDLNKEVKIKCEDAASISKETSKYHINSDTSCINNYNDFIGKLCDLEKKSIELDSIIEDYNI